MFIGNIEFARKKGSKDKTKRKRRRVVGAIAAGAAVAGGAAALSRRKKGFTGKALPGRVMRSANPNSFENLRRSAADGVRGAATSVSKNLKSKKSKFSNAVKDRFSRRAPKSRQIESSMDRKLRKADESIETLRKGRINSQAAVSRNRRKTRRA